MKNLLLILLALLLRVLCFAQDSSRIVFLRMDAPITSHTSSVGESRMYTDAIMVNETEITKIRSCSIFIYDHPAPIGTYYLRPFVNQDEAGQKKLTLRPPAHSITFVKLSLGSGTPITSWAETVTAEDFEICYQKNKWLRKKLAAEGFNSIEELTAGYVISRAQTSFVVKDGIPFLIPKKRNVGDTAFYYHDGHLTMRSFAKYYSVVGKDSAGYFPVSSYYVSTGQLKMQGHYSDIDSATREGAFVYYSEKGRISSTGNYLHNHETGAWEFHYDTLNAPLWYTCNYINGHMQGELTTYYLDGKLKRKEQRMYIEGENISGRHGKSSVATRGYDSVLSGICYDHGGKEIPFTRFEIIPKASYDINNYLAHNILYPAYAREHSIHGRVIVKFTISATGKVTDVSIAKSVSPDIDKEAIRVVEEMPDWQPGLQDDKPVPVFFTLPINFKLK